MAGVRFSNGPSRPIECLDLTRLTLDELEPLGPPFEAAFQAHMAHWRGDGMELCCALHHFRVRLSPWQPMI